MRFASSGRHPFAFTATFRLPGAFLQIALCSLVRGGNELAHYSFAVSLLAIHMPSPFAEPNDANATISTMSMTRMHDLQS